MIDLDQAVFWWGVFWLGGLAVLYAATRLVRWLRRKSRGSHG